MVDVGFESLGLSRELLSAVKARGYTDPTPIQSAAIPAILSGRDVLACAQTGSGKTAAFGLPLLERLRTTPQERPRRLLALVLVPTRELAAQVAEELRQLTRGFTRSIAIHAVFGGVSINPQMMAMRGGADVVVATPGRLLDLVERGSLYLQGVATLVLDEADRLLDLGFAEELQRILERLPARRQSLLFSATFPPKVRSLADRLLTSPRKLDVPRVDIETPSIEQRAIAVDGHARSNLLRHLLRAHAWPSVLVFVATKRATEQLAEQLCRGGIAAAPLHGELSQTSRSEALARFKASEIRVLVATDLAARGIHVEELSAVVNYDLPRSADDYLHRIGRTGRAGNAGISLSFVRAEDESHFGLIEKRHALSLAREQIQGFERTEAEAPRTIHVGDSNGGIKGRRKSKKDKLREAAARAASGLPAPTKTDHRT